MRTVAISDLHGTLPEIPECDLLLIGGDVTPVWNHERKFQADWLCGEFAEWLDAQPAQVIAGIAGNHDFVLQENPKLGYELPWAYFANEARTVKLSENVIQARDLKVYGSPYSNKFGNWAFMKTENELAKMWDEIPRDIDILLVHGPPYGFGDKVGKTWRNGGWVDERVGSTSLANHLTYEVWPKLKLVVFGHIHEGYGEYSLKSWRMLNATQMDAAYNPTNPPMVIEL